MEAQIKRLKESLESNIDYKQLCEIIELLKKHFEELTDEESQDE